MRAMSTPVGHSRLQPLHETQSVQRVAHLVGDQRLGAELAGQREAQRVGAAAGQMLLVAGRAVGRAHHAGVGFAAGAVVVAHLGGAGEASPIPTSRARCRAAAAGSPA